MPRKIDISGHRFGRLTALRPLPSVGRCTVWLCQCDCGKSSEVLTFALRGGSTKSCGCLQYEISLATLAKARTTHGESDAPEYSVWCGIKRRCENPHERSFQNYGARGVRVLFGSFESFLAHVGRRPSAQHSIDRIDPNGHYEHGNVRWALPSTQARNRRSALLVTIDGRQRPLKDWCEDLGQGYHKVWLRIRRYGWTPEAALGL